MEHADEEDFADYVEICDAEDILSHVKTELLHDVVQVKEEKKEEKEEEDNDEGKESVWKDVDEVLDYYEQSHIHQSEDVSLTENSQLENALISKEVENSLRLSHVAQCSSSVNDLKHDVKIEPLTNHNKQQPIAYLSYSIKNDMPVEDHKNILHEKESKEQASKSFEYKIPNAKTDMQPQGQIEGTCSNSSFTEIVKQKKEDVSQNSPCVQGKILFSKSVIVNKNVFQCEVCRKSFAKRKHVNKHLRIHEEIFKCDVCLKCFVSRSSLHKHKAVHEAKAYKCSICEKHFAHKSSLDKHKAVHEPKAYKCSICEKHFVNKSRLNKHLLKKYTYKCKACNDTFHSKTDLTEHLVIHKHEKCIICYRYITEKQISDDKFETYKSGNMYRCPICKKKFPKKHFFAHLKCHECKQYKCDICQKCFCRKPNIIKHMTSHLKRENL